MQYYVNKNAQDNGDHEVHTADCAWLPDREHRRYLGDFSNCRDAVASAKQFYSQSNGCYYCCRPCHTG